MSEPVITINGTPLSEPQAMTVRVALETFAATLATEGLGDDNSDHIITAAYQARIREVWAMLHSTPNVVSKVEEQR